MDANESFSMSGRSINSKRYSALLALLAGIAILFFLAPGTYFQMSQSAYLPLHSALEFSSIMVAFMVFGITWHSLSQTQAANISLLGCAMLATGLLDFAHTISYKGMPDFVTPSSPEKGIAFWLAARMTVAVSLCIYSFMSAASLRKPYYRYAFLSAYACYTVAIYWLVLFHQDWLPKTFIDGQGLTDFKIACEWSIIILLAVAASRFFHSSENRLDQKLKIYFFTAAVVFIMSEMFFTQYKTTSDVFNVLGHLYKIVGDYLLYQAVFVTTIQEPYHEVERQQIRYRQLFENMTSCGVVYRAVEKGRDFVILDVNQAAERTEKISRENFVGKRVTELFPGVHDFGLLDVLRRVWRTGRSEYFPAKFYQDNRISGWRENFLYRLADGNIVAVYEDITERKLANQALQESEKNFRVIFETAAIGMAEADPVTGRFLRVNMKFCRMTGYSAEELLNMSFAMITHADDLEKNMKGWRRLMRGEAGEFTVERRFVHKDGREIWAHLNAVALRDENEKIVRVLAAIMDITVGKQAKADRRRYNRELKSIFDALPDFYFRLAGDGTILSYHANSAAKGNLFLPPEQFLGRRMIEILPPPLEALFTEKLNEQRSSGRIITFEYQLNLSGAERYYEARLANLGDSGDIIVLVRDIVERKLLEQQLQQAQKMEALGQLTGGIAHDFNNILAAILGYSNLALERCVTDPSDKLGRYLREVVSASERARDLISKMLAYSRTSSTVASIPLNMVAEVEKAVAMLSVALPAGIKVVTRIAAYVPPVRIDPIDVQQILVNLAVNARDAIGEQGKIEIVLDRVRINGDACAICHNVVAGDFVLLEVNDSGHGIPAHLLQRIFDPFFTTKDIGKGSGLGLSMVQGIVIKNNAHLLIDTAPDQGTRFRLLFPFVDSEALTQIAPVSSHAAPEVPCRRIWVVEDQKPLAGYYMELLQEQGYRVTVFSDPTEALAAFRNDVDAVDIVLTDQTMPDLSGAEMAAAMLLLRPELPIVLITGYSERINAEEAKRIGIRCYLNKPVDGNKLLDMLATELCCAEKG